MFADNRIKKIHTPKELSVVWNKRGRSRYIVGQLLVGDGNRIALSYHETSNDYKKAIREGFVPLFDLSENAKTNDLPNDVMDFFMSRITSRERSDFSLYLASLGIDLSLLNIDPNDKHTFSDFSLLGYGEARLPSDGLHIINSYCNAIPPIQFVTEVSALQYGQYTTLEILDEIKVGKQARLVRETKNPADTNAVKVELNSKLLGYINKVQAPTISKWLKKGHRIKVTIFRKNGRRQSPRIFVFLDVKGIKKSN